MGPRGWRPFGWLNKDSFRQDLPVVLRRESLHSLEPPVDCVADVLRDGVVVGKRWRVLEPGDVRAHVCADVCELGERVGVEGVPVEGHSCLESWQQ